MKLKRDVDAELARRHLFDFAKFTSPAHYNWGWHHRLLYSWLNDVADGRRKRVIIEAPPGHGKSEGTSRRLPAYLFGKMIGARIIGCSHTADLAEELARDVQQVIESDSYRTVFPNAGMARVKGRQRADLFDLQGGGIYKCAGVGGGIGGRRFDLGIIDDPLKDRVAANSPANREHIWRWYTSVFHKRQAKDASILITSTRWHQDDLVGRLKKKMAVGECEPFDVLTLPLLAQPGQVRNVDDPRQDGETLWPWFRTTAEAENMRTLEPRDFAALEQQMPGAEGDVEWPAEYFERPGFFCVGMPTQRIGRFMFYDGAGHPSAKVGDWHACALLSITADGDLWFDMRLWRGSQEQAADRLCELMIEFNPDACGVEANFGGNTMVSLIGYAAQKFGRTDLVGKWFGVHNTLPKPSRIRRIGPYLAKGIVHIVDNQGGRETVRQWQQFPAADHDDGPDAADGSLQVASHYLQVV